MHGLNFLANSLTKQMSVSEVGLVWTAAGYWFRRIRKGVLTDICRTGDGNAAVFHCNISQLEQRILERTITVNYDADCRRT